MALKLSAASLQASTSASPERQIARAVFFGNPRDAHAAAVAGQAASTPRATSP